MPRRLCCAACESHAERALSSAARHLNRRLPMNLPTDSGRPQMRTQQASSPRPSPPEEEREKALRSWFRGSMREPVGGILSPTLSPRSFLAERGRTAEPAAGAKFVGPCYALLYMAQKLSSGATGSKFWP